MDLNRGAVASPAEPPSPQVREAWPPASAEELFSRPGPRAQVIVKRRRLPSVLPSVTGHVGVGDASAEPAAATSTSTPATGVNRTPRVFTTKRSDEQPAPSVPAGGQVDDRPTSATTPRRRQRPAAHRPGEVIRLVLRTDADTAAGSPAAWATSSAGASPEAAPAPAFAATAFEAQAGLSSLELSGPGLEQHQAVMTALEAVSLLVEEALAASRLRF